MKKQLSALCLALGAAGGAQAGLITGQDIYNDYYNPGSSPLFSVSATSPWTNNVQLGLKTQDGLTGVGVQGMTDGEIDWRNGQTESITLTFGSAVRIGGFTLGLLFNGPEYNDVQEVARIVIDGWDSYVLKALSAENLAAWYHGSTLLGYFSYLPGQGTQLGQGGAISMSNPFGDRLVSSLTFMAAQGVSGNQCGANGGWGTCTNQSDYNVIDLKVSEPQTLALMLAGVAAAGFASRRRRDEKA